MSKRKGAHHRVVLDLQACQTEASRGRGIGRYSGNLARALLESPDPFRISIAFNGSLVDGPADALPDFVTDVGPDRLIRYHATQPSATWSADAVDAGAVAGEALARYAWLADKPDLIHVSSLFEGLRGSGVVPSLRNMPAATAVSATIYDLIPLVFSDIYLTDATTRAWYMSRLERVRRCDVLLAISEATRCDVIEHVGIAPDRVVNILGSVDARFTPPRREDPKPATIAALGLTRPYVMYTGGIDHRKNVEALIRAYGQLPRGIAGTRQLAIVCSMQDQDRVRLEKLARRSGLAPDDVVLTGFVADETLVDLYRHCELFVFPSLYEGFGLPALEAMACGAPTIAANTSSLPEIIAREDALFDPRSDEAISRALARALANTDFLESLRVHAIRRASLFSWQATAGRARDAWNEAIARRSAQAMTPAPLRPRLAVVTPLYPERSGIAHFAGDLLPYLARHFDIELFVSSRVDRDRLAELGFAAHGWETLPSCYSEYDAGVLYQMGNSEFHVHMLALLALCPGTVVLHDAYLSGLMAYCEFGPPALDGLFGDMLAYCHPELASSTAADRDGVIERCSMSRWVADHALGVVVTSGHALSLLQQQEQVDRARCAVIPLQREARALTDVDRVQAKRALGIAESALLVCTFGYLDERKLSLELVEAWVRRAMPPDARLVFVGEASSIYGEAVARRGARARNVSITAYVDDDRFDTYLRAADVVVQLRKGSRGELSGAALSALAYGAALLTSRHGSLAEIPDDVCVHVDSPLDVEQLAASLAALLDDPARRRALGEKARAWVGDTCAPEEVARQLAVHVHRYNDRTFVDLDTGLERHLEPISRLVSEDARAAWITDVRARARRSVSPRLNSNAARAIDRTLSPLLPHALPGEPSDARAQGLLATSDAIVLSADDVRLATRCGVKADGVIRSTGNPGLLLHGPYLPIEAGSYRVRVFGSCVPAATAAPRIDVTGERGALRLAQQPLDFDVALGADGLLGRLDFATDRSIADLEIRIHVPGNVRMAIESLDLVRLPPNSTDL